MMTEEISAVIRESLWHMDAELDKLGWDQPPQLFIVLKVEGERALAIMPLPGFDTVHGLSEGDMQRTIWHLNHGYQTMPAEIAPQFAGEALGVVLATEAWMIRNEAPDFGKVAPTDSPNRVEVRVLHLAPAEGASAALMHERDGIADIKVAGDGGQDVGGALPELLAALAQTMAKHTNKEDA